MKSIRLISILEELRDEERTREQSGELDTAATERLRELEEIIDRLKRGDENVPPDRLRRILEAMFAGGVIELLSKLPELIESLGG